MSQVPAATRTMRVLRFLASQPGPVPLDRVMRACDLPRSTAYHLLGTMVDEGFVVHLPEEKCYGLGVAAFGAIALLLPRTLSKAPPASLLDQFSLSSYPRMGETDRFVVFGTDSASAAEGLSRHVYALRRGDQRLQMQVYVTQSNADANRMGVETRPPAVSVVLGEKLVRLVPPPNGDAATAIELARDLTAFRNRTR